MADGLKLKVISSGVICVILFALAEPIANAYNVPELTWPLRGGGAGAVRPEHDGLLPDRFEAIGRVRLNLRLVFSESAVEAGASIALVLAGAGVVGAAFGRAIGYAFGTALALYLARQAIGARGDLAARQPGRAAAPDRALRGRAADHRRDLRAP